MSRISYRFTLLIVATISLYAVLFYANGETRAPDTLPTRLTDREFWRMVTEFSEAGGYFRSDNFLSNELGYQRVIPVLRKSVRSGGVYLGVGPEQNFTYVVGLEPKIAFIVDIRRQNMLEHLLYKALMELSEERPEFLSKLFSRPRPSAVDRHSSPEDLVSAYQQVQPSDVLFESNLRAVLDYLETKKGFELSDDDEAAVRRVYQAFFESGPNLSYTLFGGSQGFMWMPTYGELMTDDDGHAHNWSFLANDEQYAMVRRLQQQNLLVPLVGDFAGPTAIRSVAGYLKRHNAVLSVFYTSNVEQYLFQDDRDWKQFYENVDTLPLDSSSMFIRYVVSSWGFNRRSRTLLSPVAEVMRAYDRGRIRSYYDVVDMSW